jgi:hypothetical protein
MEELLQTIILRGPCWGYLYNEARSTQLLFGEKFYVMCDYSDNWSV